MHRLLFVLAVLAPACAGAQAPRPDPADAKAAVPPLRYESVVPAPRPPEKPVDWKKKNEDVARLGGHVGHLKSLGEAMKEPQAPAGHPHKH